MYIDTHAHLNFDDFKTDFESVILRAQKANVEKIINIGSDYKSSHKSIELSQKFSRVYAAIGLHPIYINKEKFDVTKYRNLAQNKKVVAFGEIGFDFGEEGKKIPTQKQISVFKEFINLAIELKKPIIIHCRDSREDLLKFLSSETKLPRGVLHCFSGDFEFAQKILDFGFLVSFTGAITYNLSNKTGDAIEKLPLEKIIIETDCPFMTPLSKREKGIKRCEPAFVKEVAKKIAEIKNLSDLEVEQSTTSNAQKLFNI